MGVVAWHLIAGRRKAALYEKTHPDEAPSETPAQPAS